MKQQCHIFFVYGSWVILLGGFVVILLRGTILEAVLWAGFAGFFLWLYVRYFPALSKLMGYGSVADQPARDLMERSETRVVLYTGVGCPFCPLVKRRLQDLKARMGFDLVEIDVTLKPDLLIAKGIRALPVIEVGETRWVGNATSEKLAAMIAGSTVPAEPAGQLS